MSAKQRSQLIETLDALPAEAPLVLLATGGVVGEEFDHPPFDTLVIGDADLFEGDPPAVLGPPVAVTERQPFRVVFRCR